MEVDEEQRQARLSLRGETVVGELSAMPQEGAPAVWHPEYAKFMLECKQRHSPVHTLTAVATPAHPYSRVFESFLDVEQNMRRRRLQAQQQLRPTERLLSTSSFPLLGLPSAFRARPWTNAASNSALVPDEAINSHARFATLTRNIRLRRGDNVRISLPVFRDTLTDAHVSTHLPTLLPTTAPAPDTAHRLEMDCMAFGMGCCCLQVTVQAADLAEARTMYDQFAVLAPLMLALTAASPVFRGVLVDTDCRWGVIEAAVDDRSPAERSIPGAPTGPRASTQLPLYAPIPKSRYSSVSRFLSPEAAALNDLALPRNAAVEKTLLAAGVDALLSAHMALLFVRDPLVVYRELLDQDCSVSSDHFENIQSTNWQTCRFKPPSLTDAALGWRVEFRPMEVQLSDRENAAFACFPVLLIRALLHFRVSLLLPLSLVDDNMARAQARDAIHAQLFHFHISPAGPVSPAPHPPRTLDRIFNDPELGLIALVRRYLDVMCVAGTVRDALERHIALVAARAAGSAPTNATLIRNFVLAHPAYARDSRVTDTINFDLINFLAQYQ